MIALYPSLLHEESARLCGDLIRTCPATFSNVDVKAATVFVATHCSPTEITRSGLGSIIPDRKHARGIKPTPSTPELTTRLGEEDAPTKFRSLCPNITPQEERMILAKVIEVGVREVIKNHIYLWRGELYLQKLGVPTGLGLSGVIGRITMDTWRTKIKQRMLDNGLRPFLLEKYVDDCELVLENVPQGTRWDGQKLVVTPESTQEDKEANKSKEEVTMTAWGQMASDLVPGLKFTTDYPSLHDDKMIPMLDFKLGKIREDDSENPGCQREALSYQFYEKPMSNMKVMDKDSAMPHKIKVATMTQEIVRRLCNTSQELDDKTKQDILSIFMRKLQLSGYSQRLRADILEAGVVTYRRKERAQVLGIQPIHRLAGFDQAARRRAKVLGKTNWFRPKRNDWKKRLLARESEEVGVHQAKPASQERQHGRGGPRSGQGSRGAGREGGAGPSTAGPTPRQGGPQAPGTNHDHVEGIMFVPHSPDGGLARSIQWEEDIFARLHRIGRVKVVERGSQRLMDLLGKKDPWAKSSCMRPDCMTCSSANKKKGSSMSCGQESICYLISCDRCHSRGGGCTLLRGVRKDPLPPRTRAPPWAGEATR